MLAPRLLRQRCLACRTTTTFATSTTRTTALPAPFLLRSFSQTPGRRYQDKEQLEEKLRNARPLLSNAAASRFTNAGRGRSSRTFVVVCVVGAVIFYFANSQTVPVTGRRRFNFLSDALVEMIGTQGADSVVREIEEQGRGFVSERDWRFREVKRVMSRLVPVSGMADVDWKIRVIDDDRTANAFVTPGGNLFVFSGIIRVCGNSDALAAVLGHEIAHNVAAHSAERMSAAFIGNLTSGSLFFLAGALPGLALFGLWTMTGGRYIQELLFNLPMGRKMESEADYIGLMMMAEACYDPTAAVGYWQRMNQLQGQGGFEVPEMLSTHPSNDHRIEKMREWLPEALEKRRESDCKGGSGAWADQFREAILSRQLIRI